MCDIGWGYYCSGQWDAALKTYQEGLDRHPDHKNAVYLQYQKIKTYLAQKDIDAAEREMEILVTRYAESDKTPGLACRLGKAYRKEGYPEEAIRVYEMVLERFPDHPQISSVRDSIVETYADMGDSVKAQEALQTDIETCPHRRELLRMMTRVAVETARVGDTDTAMALVGEIFNQNPEGVDQQLFGYATRARVYVHQGKDAEAAATVDEALEQFNDHPDALSYHLFGAGEEYYFLAQEATKKQDPELAARYYQKAIETWEHLLIELPGSNNPHYEYYLGISYQNIGQMDRAMQYYSQVVTKWPDYEKAWDAQFMIVRICRNLKRDGKLAGIDADSIIRAGCDNILQRYPQSPVASMARRWLGEVSPAQ